MIVIIEDEGFDGHLLPYVNITYLMRRILKIVATIGNISNHVIPA